MRNKEKKARKDCEYRMANRDKINRNHRAAYRRDPQKAIARKRASGAKARQRNYVFLRQYVKDHPCVDCGQVFHFAAMDFDHVRGEKVAGISRLAAQPASMEKILAEVAKCDIRCANCHRTRTFKVPVEEGRAWE